MDDFVETIGLGSLLQDQGINYVNRNFEEVYSDFCTKIPVMDKLSKLSRIECGSTLFNWSCRLTQHYTTI